MKTPAQSLPSIPKGETSLVGLSLRSNDIRDQALYSTNEEARFEGTKWEWSRTALAFFLMGLLVTTIAAF